MRHSGDIGHIVQDAVAVTRSKSSEEEAAFRDHMKIEMNLSRDNILKQENALNEYIGYANIMAEGADNSENGEYKPT